MIPDDAASSQPNSRAPPVWSIHPCWGDLRVHPNTGEYGRDKPEDDWRSLSRPGCERT